MRIRTLFALLLGCLALVPTGAADTSVTYAAKPGPGNGRHVVLLAGDEEYRSEEALPMLAKILSQRHGFKCTVLFSVDPDGTINPKSTKSVSNPEALDSADVVVMSLRFRAWPDEDMARFDKLLRAGKPIVALRTSTHAFNGFPKGSPWESWNYNNQGGFGKRVLGETWVTHWGRHKVEATRGVIEGSERAHPRLRGVTDIFGDTDVYEAYPPADATILVRGLVLQSLAADSAPADYRKARATDKGQQGVNDPPMPIVWTRLHKNDNGTTNRIVTTTMGSATDLENEGLRRLVVNGVYWGLGLDVPARADVTYVDEYVPSFYGFDGFRKGLRASDFELGKKVPGEPLPRPVPGTGRGGLARQDASLADVLSATSFRNIGPFRTSAWITEIAVPETPARDHLYTIYAATRSGGLWKTTNNGTTWEAISDSVEVAAVGAVALAPSNPSIVWMGTGDQANARSSYSGKGVFKSDDAGKTWQLMGLPDSHHIARIVIHPTNPDIVYVAAMGHLFSRNEERGVFRTRNGGRTWEKVLYVDAGTGAIDLAMNRKSPDMLYAAMYEKDRLPWQLVLGGPGSAVYRTDDGGTKWRKLDGLPSGNVGRIGLDVNARNPNLLTLIVENLNPRKDGMPVRVDACQTGGGASTGSGRGGRAGGPIGNEVYRSEDGGKTWKKTHGDDIDVAGSKAPYSFNQIKTNPADPTQIIVNSDSMYESRDGGKTWNCQFFRGVFGDFRTMWWDEQDPQRIMLGSDGGVNVSYDGGRTTDYFPNKKIGEVYAVGVDMDDPYNVYAGLQDHDSWKGPSNSRSGMITLENWTTVGTGDGMYNQVDPTSSRWVYNTFQAGGQRRFDQLTGQAVNIQPQRPQGATALRYNWVTPIVLSPHNPQIVYTGAQVLFRSLNRGDAWQEISPDLTTADSTKCGLNSGFVPYCTITSVSESPITPGVIWVGTDDGKVQLTRDHGGTWTDLTAAVAAAGVPADRYVSRVFASPHDAGTAFVAKNGFRNDDFRPFLYRTNDFGKTWTAIAGNLVDSPINVVVQDRKWSNLLIVGNDLGVYVSIDAGVSWSRLKANLPTVPVHDLTVHPRENDLVLGTYGRGLFIGDITHLQELSPEVLAKPFHLFGVEPRAAYGFRALGNFHLFGHKYIEVPNEPDALVINYYLRAKADTGARVTVADAKGDQIAQLKGPSDTGLNRVVWNMRAGSGPPAGGRGGPGGRRGGGGPLLPAGDYWITVEVAGQQQSTIGRIRDRIR